MDGVEYVTFKMAAIARNLLEDDWVWNRTMVEAVAFQMPTQLRHLFVNTCTYCNLTDAPGMFETHLRHLTEDFDRRGHEQTIARNLALKWIQDKLQANGIGMERELQLPAPDFNLINQLVSSEITGIRDGDADGRVRDMMRLRGDVMMAQLNEGG